MAMRGIRPKRSYTSLDDKEKKKIIALWHKFKGAGSIGNDMGLAHSTVNMFLVKNGYVRTRKEQLEGCRRLKELNEI